MKLKILLFLVIGVIGSIAPIIFVSVNYYLLGNYNQNFNAAKMEIIQDLLLVAFAIALNTMSVLFDTSDDKFYFTAKLLATIACIIIGFSMFNTVFGYITAVNNIMFEITNIDQPAKTGIEIYEETLKIEKAKDIVLNNVKWMGYFWMAIIITVINCIIGITAIYRDYHPRKPKSTVTTEEKTDNTEAEADSTEKKTDSTEREDGHQNEVTEL